MSRDLGGRHFKWSVSPGMIVNYELMDAGMHEALLLWDSICNSQWFVKTSFVSGYPSHLRACIDRPRLSDSLPQQGATTGLHWMDGSD